MVNPGTYTGLRLAFLDSKNEEYSNAVKMHIVDDVVSNIQRQYFKRFPVTLPLNEEPTAEWLAQVNDDAPDPEILPPNEKDYATSDEYVQAMFKYDELGRELISRKASIKRRLLYNYNKQRKSLAAGKAEDPMRAVADKFLGIDKLKKPRMKTPFNIWGPEHRFIVEPIFKQRVHAGDVPPKKQLALRSAVYKELFDELPDDERQEYIDRAELEHEEALEQMYTKLRSPASQKPEDLQLAIESVTGLLSPLLDIISEHTGFKWSCFGGGPEPADGGRINIISIHSGVTTGSVKMNFARSERADFKRHVIPIFGTFVQKCYTVAECRARALDSTNTSATKLSALRAEEGGFDIHQLGPMVERKKTSEEILVARLKDKDDQKRRKDKKHKKGSAPKHGSGSTTTPADDAAPIKIGPPKGKKKAKNSTNTIATSSGAVTELNDTSQGTKSDGGVSNTTKDVAVELNGATSSSAITELDNTSKGTQCDGSISNTTKDAAVELNGATSSSAVTELNNGAKGPKSDGGFSNITNNAAAALHSTNMVATSSSAVTELDDASKGTKSDEDVSNTTTKVAVALNGATSSSAVTELDNASNGTKSDGGMSNATNNPAVALNGTDIIATSSSAVMELDDASKSDNSTSKSTDDAFAVRNVASVSGMVSSSNAKLNSGADDNDSISDWTGTSTTTSNGANASAVPSNGVTGIDSTSKGPNDDDSISNWTSSTSTVSNSIDAGATVSGDVMAIVDASKNTTHNKDVSNVSSPPGPAPSRRSSPALQIIQKNDKMDKMNHQRTRGDAGNGRAAGLLSTTPPPPPPLPISRKASPSPLSTRPPGAAAMLEYSDDEGNNEDNNEGNDVTPPEPVRKRKSDDISTAAPKKKAKTGAQSSKRKSQGSQGGSKKKKQKLSVEDLKLAFDVVVPDGHADWVPEAVALLASADLGGQWKALVRAWLSFEDSREYAETKLPTTSRPQVVADWINRARPHTYRPTVNINTFELGFEKWWRSFQPGWRLRDSTGGLAKSDDGNWDRMQYTGVNGLLSVLAGLFFWGTASANNTWHAAVDDVLYALQSML